MSLPGMPSIPNFKGLVTGGTTALTGALGAAIIRGVFGNRWGVFNQFGIPILLADTFESLQYTNTSQVAQAPVENGSFASYNKVQNPYKASVILTKGVGGPTQRGIFIAQLEMLQRSTLLFHIVTPDFVHINANIIGFDYARNPQDGARIIVAKLHFEEVREVKIRYEAVERPKNPADSSVVDQGEQAKVGADQSLLIRIKNSDMLQSGIDTVRNLVDKVSGIFDGGVTP